MSSDDEKAAIEARLIDKIKRKEPQWQEASLGLFLLKASELPAREREIAIEKVMRDAPHTRLPVIHLPTIAASAADTSDTEYKSGKRGCYRPGRSRREGDYHWGQ